MKLLLVTGSDDTYSFISRSVKSLGCELIRYNHVIKAMDNIDEIDPSVIVISAKDYPKHWKTMTQFVRSERSKEVCPIIIIRGEYFPPEEIAKAEYLEVKAMIYETADSPDEKNALKEILGSLAPDGPMPVDTPDEAAVETEATEEDAGGGLRAAEGQKTGFVFSRPGDDVLVTGGVKAISSDRFIFVPDDSALMDDIIVDTILEDCSLRAGDSILSPVCRIAETENEIVVGFLSFPEGEREIFAGCLESLPPL